MKTNFNIKIGGHAGEGIKVSGLVLARSLTRLGFCVFGYSEYPSLIRGGHNSYQIHAGIDKVYSQVKNIDLLIALNQETIKLYQQDLSYNSLIIYDSSEFSLPKGKLIGKYLDIKLLEIIKKAGAKPIMANMAGLGAILTLLGLPLSSLNKLIEEQFFKKGKQIVKLNQKVVLAGKKYVLKNYKKHVLKVNLPKASKKRMILTGNEAVALGAIAGGLQAYFAYPMTPSTSILHYLVKNAIDADILVKHVEDEISAINMSIGSSFTGARTMTATSGGGLCLMAEGITLAGVSETPIVIVNSMRPGPALGMPTWTAQSDLQFVLNIGHDEFPRIVLTPGDSQEAFKLSKLSLYLAEKYQLPVFLLIDKYISESDYSHLPFKSVHLNSRINIIKKPLKEYKRYLLTENGISLRSLPGTKNNAFCCNSYEHDERGFGTEDGALRNQMMDKRMLKLKTLMQDCPDQPIYGSKKSKLSLISWGSNKSPILEALKNKPDINYLHLNWLWPFPKKQVAGFIKNSKRIICLECNATGQLASLIKKETGLKVKSLLKYNGRPFWPEEIITNLTNLPN